MPIDAGAASAATVSIGQTVGVYSYFLPKLQEVRHASGNDNEMRQDVLIGQVAAGSLSMAVGVLLSWMTGSPVPTYTTLFIAIIIAVVYQYALSTRGVDE